MLYFCFIKKRKDYINNHFVSRFKRLKSQRNVKTILIITLFLLIKKNMKIDFNNIQSHIEIIQFKNKKFICDKNHKTQDDPKSYIIAEIKINYCNWWAFTSNRSKVLTYFKNKYNE